MGLDLWFREDVVRILASTHEAMQAASRAMSHEAGDDEGEVYRQGFTDALRAVGVAFGVCLPDAGWDMGTEDCAVGHPHRPQVEGGAPLWLRSPRLPPWR